MEMAKEEVSVINVALNGDVLLELASPGGRTRLLVSSAVLSLSSEVFARMLISQFKEGVGGNNPSGACRIIPLPDEDLEAFTLLCNVIHFRMDLVPRKPTIASLEKLAVISDKWDFTSAIAASSELWLQNLVRETSGPDLYSWPISLILLAHSRTYLGKF